MCPRKLVETNLLEQLIDLLHDQRLTEQKVTRYIYGLYVVLEVFSGLPIFSVTLYYMISKQLVTLVYGRHCKTIVGESEESRDSGTGLLYTQTVSWMAGTMRLMKMSESRSRWLINCVWVRER